MRVRELPYAEWSRLAEETQAPQIAPALGRGGTVVLVVEDAAGWIQACATVALIPHVDSLWVRPDARRNLGVGRALMRAILGTAHKFGPYFIASAETPEVASMWERMGARRSPLTFFLQFLDEVTHAVRNHSAPRVRNSAA